MVLVTGATGHIGNVLVKMLLKCGEKVRVLVLPNEDLFSIENLKVEIMRGDVRDSLDVEKAVKGCEEVYHLAGVISIGNVKRKQVWDVNVKGTENVLRAVKKYHTNRLLYFSSVHAFSEIQSGIIDESVPFDPQHVTGTYAKSKATAALSVLNAAKSGLDVVTVCPSGVIGPYDYKPSAMGRMVLDFLNDKLPFSIEGSFDFVDVRDVVDGSIHAMKKGKKGETYILSGENTSLNRIMQELRKITGKRGPIKMLKTGTAYFLSYMVLMGAYVMRTSTLFTPYSVHTLSTRSLFSHEKATAELGYSPRSISLTLKDTVEWFESWLKRERKAS